MKKVRGFAKPGSRQVGTSYRPAFATIGLICINIVSLLVMHKSVSGSQDQRRTLSISRDPERPTLANTDYAKRWLRLVGRRGSGAGGAAVTCGIRRNSGWCFKRGTYGSRGWCRPRRKPPLIISAGYTNRRKRTRRSRGFDQAIRTDPHAAASPLDALPVTDRRTHSLGGENLR